MTAYDGVLPRTARPRGFVDVAALVAVFVAAVAIRLALAGPAGPASMRGGVAMGAVLAFVAVACRCGARLTGRGVAVGVLGAAVVVAPALVVNGWPSWFDPSGYGRWAAVVVFIAVAEEAFLRGALFTALESWRGRDVAVVGAAVVFALLHVPLYGWHVVPVDFAVGLVFGALRVATGTWTAAAIAHVGADLAGWWLV